ncbi:MAG: hypothetical protein KAT58_06925 [candidate division Zixibacteria bacterium]|nr:hypothetical protein [candidate division Zixibacteria bacterium]
MVADKPIGQHSICAGMLADMAIGIETARNYYLTAAYMYDHPDTSGPPVSILCCPEQVKGTGQYSMSPFNNLIPQPFSSPRFSSPFSKAYLLWI